MKKIVLLLIIISTLFVSTPLLAFELSKDDEIYVSGETVGIKVKTGVEVIGTYSINVDGKNCSPWKDSGISVGDKIISVEDITVDTVDEMSNTLRKLNLETVCVTFSHKDEIKKATFKTVLKNGNYSLGLLVKDKVVGIGTLTYVIPVYNIYGALGHSISSNDNFLSGEIYNATVTDIKKATEKTVGEKKASINELIIGDVNKNVETGIHGTINNIEYLQLRKYKIAKRDEVKKGAATILTTIDGDKIEEFEVQIVGVENQNKKSVKGIKVKITDERLIDATGGIIQGMSGSPIIQNGKIIGALTHVLVAEPKQGYGIFIEWMLSDMGVTVE